MKPSLILLADQADVTFILNKYFLIYVINNIVTVNIEQAISKAMSQHKQPQKKPKQKRSPSPSHIQTQLKSLISSLNNFLKQHFDYSYTNLPEYSEQVKQYFIEESTNSTYSCLLSTFLSKISNMLQPFLQVNNQNVRNCQENSVQEFKMREEISAMKGKMEKMEKKIGKLKEQIKQYRVTSGKLTNFVYMLRVNNIDVDSLYEKGCRQPERDISFSRQSNTENMRHPQIISNFQTQ